MENFNHAAAQQLIDQCNTVCRTLESQAGERQTISATALEDFKGTYSVLFCEASRQESDDRQNLIRTLRSLASQVDDAKADAEREERRRQDHADWLARQSARGEYCLANTPSSFSSPDSSYGISYDPSISYRVYDPEPNPIPDYPAECSGQLLYRVPATFAIIF